MKSPPESHCAKTESKFCDLGKAQWYWEVHTIQRKSSALHRSLYGSTELSQDGLAATGGRCAMQAALCCRQSHRPACGSTPSRSSLLHWLASLPSPMAASQTAALHCFAPLSSLLAIVFMTYKCWYAGMKVAFLRESVEQWFCKHVAMPGMLLEL